MINPLRSLCSWGLNIACGAAPAAVLGSITGTEGALLGASFGGVAGAFLGSNRDLKIAALCLGAAIGTGPLLGQMEEKLSPRTVVVSEQITPR